MRAAIHCVSQDHSTLASSCSSPPLCSPSAITCLPSPPFSSLSLSSRVLTSHMPPPTPSRPRARTTTLPSRLPSSLPSFPRLFAISFTRLLKIFLAYTEADNSGVRSAGPALLYCDSRASKEAAELEAQFGKETLHARTLNWKGAVSVLPKLLWLQRHEPHAVAAAAAVSLSAHDFLYLRLTGEHATDRTNASTTGLLNRQRK